MLCRRKSGTFEAFQITADLDWPDWVSQNVETKRDSSHGWDLAAYPTHGDWEFGVWGDWLMRFQDSGVISFCTDEEFQGQFEEVEA